MKSRTVKQEAQKNGYRWRTVERASKKLGVIKRREGFGKDAAYTWALRSCSPENTMSTMPASHKSMADMASMDGNAAKAPARNGSDWTEEY